MLTENHENNMMIPYKGDLCMRGGVYTKEKCPVCEGPFKPINNELFCPDHFSRPKRYYVKLYSRELKKNIGIYSDYRGIPFSSYEQAFRVLEKIRVEIDGGVFEVSRYVSEKLKPLQFKAWADHWLQEREIEVEKKLISPSYLKELRRFVAIFQDHFERADIRDINTKKVREFYLTLNGSPKYISNICSCLHKMMTDALDWGDIGKVPKFPEIEIPETDFNVIDLNTQDRIIESIPDLMDRAYILFTARQMVRPSETRALFWDDIDFKNDRVTIRRHFSLNELLQATKSKRIKILPLDSKVKETLLKQPRHIRSPFVFHKEDGRPYGESYARKLWNVVSSEMGIRISLYQGTKHSSATEALNRTGSMDLVKEFLGHTRSTMTRRYAKMDPSGLKAVLRESK